MSNNDIQLAQRLQFMQFDEASHEVLRELRPFVNRFIGEALSGFYDQVRATPETRKFFVDDNLIQSAKNRQEKHWDSIASAQFDETYAKAVLAIGNTHARIGLEPRWYIGGYALVTDALVRALISDRESSLFKRFTHDPAELGKAVGVLVKAVMLDMDLAISTYLDALNESRRKVEEAQAEGVRQQMLALDTIRQSLSQMAAGNMTTRLDANLAPEFDGLKHDFNKTAEKLNDVIVAVIASMGVIESGNRLPTTWPGEPNSRRPHSNRRLQRSHRSPRGCAPPLRVSCTRAGWRPQRRRMRRIPVKW